MLCLAQYSRRVIPLSAKPATMFRISCLLRIPPFSAPSLAQSRWVPQTLTLQPVFRRGFAHAKFDLGCVVVFKPSALHAEAEKRAIAIKLFFFRAISERLINRRCSFLIMRGARMA